jgi:nucleoside 2-deoxyribosyltransferase
MLIYLACSYSNHPLMREYREVLKQNGHEVTSRWINGKHEVLEGQSMDINVRFAEVDWDDLMRADVMIFVVPESSKRGRGGRHVEFGIALAKDIPIFVIGWRENVFHWLPQVTHVDSLEDAICRITLL